MPTVVKSGLTLGPPTGTGVVLIVLLCCPATWGMSKDKQFKHDLNAVEDETGETFELHSQGTLAQIVDLDRMPEVKRVACAGDRLMILMNDTTPALEWKAGQVILGGPEWGCNVTRARPQPTSIYVKLASVFFPLEGQVTVHHVPAGPFDMMEDAKIHFHYEPGKSTKGAKHGEPAEERLEKKRRYRRSLANLVSNILNNVNWQANFSTTIPFNIGGEFVRIANGSDIALGNETKRMNLALHKSWGDEDMTVSRGRDVKKVTDDFVLNLDNMYGDTDLSYTFDLEIKSVNGDPQIVRYINQFDVQANLEADASISFKRELGVTFNVTLDQTPTMELFRVPVAQPRGVPPVYLTVSYNALSAATVSAYSAGKATLKSAFNATGYLTASQKFDPAAKVGSDVTSRNWTIQPWDQHLRSQYRTHVDFSVYQKLTFISSVAWHYHDVDIELSPPVEVTVRPEVSLRSTTPDVGRCVQSSMKVDSHVHAGKADFTAIAFGLRLWDVALQPSMSRDLHLIDGDLGQGCDARCHGPSNVMKEPMNQTQQIVPFSRQDPSFSSLRVFTGDSVLFSDDVTRNATWCGRSGSPCISCLQHSTGNTTALTCAPRLMTSRMVASMALLVDYVRFEWPDKRLMVLEAWDEPTSENPTGRHGDDSLYKVGRAATVTLANSLNLEDDLDQVTLDRLGQMAVCAGFDLVREADNETRLLQVAVAEDGSGSVNEELEERKQMFWDAMENMDVSALSPKCTSAPHLTVGDAWPQTGGPEPRCGPVERPLHRGDRDHMGTLIQWNRTEAILTFDAEGQSDKWCGHSSRPCRDQCDQPSGDLEPWNWCSTRMMTPRTAMRLRKLQMLSQENGLSIRVMQSFTEMTETQNTSASLYHEGRALKLSATPPAQLGTLASLAVCAGFDYVSYTDPTFIEVFVKAQAGYQAVLTNYIEGAAKAAVTPAGVDDLEYSYPANLAQESVLPMLVDGGFHPDTFLSEHVRLRNVMSRDRRYFRLDTSLLECIELAEDNFAGTIEIIPDSLYRTRSVNVRNNFDLRHPQELWRFQTGQAMEVRPSGAVDSARLLELATSILRECPTLVRLQMRALGLGCHDDRIYVDLRPLVPGHERVYVIVWNNNNRTDYCTDVMKLQRDMIEGGPVVQSVPEISCRDRQLDPGLEYLSFQMGQQSHCQVEGQAEFCAHSKAAREKAADTLQKLLTSAAGYGRLPRYELITEIRACLVDVCGGCAGVGPVFDQKVRACSRLVHKYIERAASPFPNLSNVTTFFNTDTELSTVQALACKEGSICVEDTPVYSLFVPTVTSRYYPDPKKSLERALFSADINPTPLLELVAQEMAFRAKGKVTVYIEAEKDTYALRNVLKVLFVYNKDVSLIEFQVAPAIDKDLVTSSIQRKLEAWSGVACPRFSRFALSPFTIITMEPERHRRSAENSVPRNKVKSRIYNWEREWLDRMW